MGPTQGSFGGRNQVSYPSTDVETIEKLDLDYQAAVARNDPAEMDRILADDFVLVTGTGRKFSKSDLLREAESRRIVYERQEDSQRTVRVWGDTAIVTAVLWAKGVEEGRPFEYQIWFSDTYARINGHWRYVLGQSGTRQDEFVRATSLSDRLKRGSTEASSLGNVTPVEQ